MGQETTALLRRSAAELAALVRTGEVRSRELVQAALDQAEANKRLNALTLLDAESALAAAEAIQPGDPRPFAGVPTAIKELHPVAGQPLTLGSDLFGDFRPNADAYAVRRLKEAGFISIGRTNAPEFGIVSVTEPRRFGPTRNPWNPDRTPGGSSGGAAAAVAAGILPVAHASDGAGSIRIPAACCGLVGLKPSRGRVSAGPAQGDDFLSTQGILTRTVGDSAAILDVMAGYEVGDAAWAPPPAEPFAVAAGRPPRPLRIALTTLSPAETAVDPVAVQAVRDAGQLLAALGHQVEEATPPDWVVPGLLPTLKVLWGAGVAANTRWGAELTRRAPSPELVEAVTWWLYEQGLANDSGAYVAAKSRLEGFSRRLVAFFQRYDVLVTPTLAQRPLRVGELNTCGADPAAEFQKAVRFTPLTVPFNVSGQPAISLPLFQGSDGLPLAVQIGGPPLGEGLLLSLAAQLEAAHPWAGRTPGQTGGG
jgi:amidase